VAKKICTGVKIVTTRCRLLCHDLDSDAEFFGDDLAFYRHFSINDLLFGDIWPLVKILPSLVVYVNHHNKDYLSKTPCNWLCGDDASSIENV